MRSLHKKSHFGVDRPDSIPSQYSFRGRETSTGVIKNADMRWHKVTDQIIKPSRCPLYVNNHWLFKCSSNVNICSEKNLELTLNYFFYVMTIKHTLHMNICTYIYKPKICFHVFTIIRITRFPHSNIYHCVKHDFFYIGLKWNEQPDKDFFLWICINILAK